VVTTIKPRLAVENRAHHGLTVSLLQGLKDNGFGKLVICGADPEKCALARNEIADIELPASVMFELRMQPALENKFEGTIDLLLCSVDHEKVSRYLLPEINPSGVLLLHAGEGEYKAMRDGVSRMEKEGIISVVRLPEGLRLLMAQKHSGRK
jgi:predicted O-methyltransferase YrrM